MTSPARPASTRRRAALSLTAFVGALAIAVACQDQTGPDAGTVRRLRPPALRANTAASSTPPLIGTISQANPENGAGSNNNIGTYATPALAEISVTGNLVQTPTDSGKKPPNNFTEMKYPVGGLTTPDAPCAGNLRIQGVNALGRLLWYQEYSPCGTTNSTVTTLVQGTVQASRYVAFKGVRARPT